MHIASRWRVTVFVAIIATTLSASGATPVSVPDPGLQALIRYELNKPSGALTDEDLAALTTVYLNPDEPVPWIGALEGLQYATNLQTFFVVFQPYTSISVLSNAFQLRELRMDGSPVADGSVLARLTNLNTLGIGGTGITNTEVISGLVSLTNLTIGGFDPTVLNQAMTLTNLDSLQIGGCSLSDLSPLLSFPRLRYVWADGNLITNMTTLTNLPALQRVSLNWNYIDLSPTGICAGAIQTLRGRGVVIELYDQKPFRTLLSLRKTAAGGLTLVADSTPGTLTYQVHWSSDLKTWQPFGSGTGSNSFPVPLILRNYPQVYFRATR